MDRVKNRCTYSSRFAPVLKTERAREREGEAPAEPLREAQWLGRSLARLCPKKLEKSRNTGRSRGRTSNVEHSTFNIEHVSAGPFDVGCSMFSVRCSPRVARQEPRPPVG